MVQGVVPKGSEIVHMTLMEVTWTCRFDKPIASGNDYFPHSRIIIVWRPRQRTCCMFA